MNITQAGVIGRIILAVDGTSVVGFSFGTSVELEVSAMKD